MVEGIKALLLVMAVFVAPGMAQASASRSFVTYAGSAYDQDADTLAYTEVHYLALEGDSVAERLVLYRCPDGTPFARKRVAPSRFESAPEFALEDRRLDYSEGLETDTGRLEVFVREAGETEVQREALSEVPDDLVADAGFDVFVLKHWTRLVAGETVHFHFLVPSRLSYLAFKVRQRSEEIIDGRPARTFRLALGGLLGLIVSGIDVSYDAQTRTILRFSGLSNVRDPDGDNYVVRIDFPPSARKLEPGPQAMEAARAEPLVKSCRT